LTVTIAMGGSTNVVLHSVEIAQGARLDLWTGFRQKKAPLCGAFPSAPERTRTSTDHTVHKALNLIQLA
jgi:dihydroxyacid dehydratase/phosphogluconate dehydratase